MAEEPNYGDRNFVLKNLAFLDKALSDETGIMEARDDIAATITAQVCFFTYLILTLLYKAEGSKAVITLQANDEVPIEGYWCKRRRRKHKPCIVIFGPTGFLGRHITEALRECGLGEFLLLYDRKNPKRAKGLHHSGPDIIINCSNSSSFTNMSRELVDRTFPHCAFISCANGLLRRRLFYIFKTVTVFRTYCEPNSYGATAATPPKNVIPAAARQRIPPPELLYKRSKGTQGVVKLLANYYHTNSGQSGEVCLNEAVHTLQTDPTAALVEQQEGRAESDVASVASNAQSVLSRANTRHIPWAPDLEDALLLLYDKYARPFAKEFSGFEYDYNEMLGNNNCSQLAVDDKPEDLMDDTDVMEVFQCDAHDDGQSPILTEILQMDDAMEEAAHKTAQEAAEARRAMESIGGGPV